MQECHDPDGVSFKRIMKLADKPYRPPTDMLAYYGPQFLIYVPGISEVLSWFCGKRSLKHQLQHIFVLIYKRRLVLYCD